MTEGKGWLEVAEKGSVTGMWALVVLTTLLGRKPTRSFLRLVAAYYALADDSVRHSSQQYLERSRGKPASPLDIYRHVFQFAGCTLDRLYFVRGKVRDFDMVSIGEEHLWRAVDDGRGAILLSSHLGSFEAMQRLADSRDLKVNIVGNFRNARMINAVLERLNPGCNAKLIELEPGGIDFVLKIRELIEAGELVSLMGDRVSDDSGRSVVVDFFGAPARFPTGAFELAAVLKCPLFFIFSLQRGDSDRYELHCDPFTDEIRLPRRGREEALRDLVQQYARRLEHYCRLAPDNWFNFFDFWEESSEEDGTREGARP